MAQNKYIVINFPQDEMINNKPKEIYGINYRQSNCPPESARAHEYLNNAIALGLQYQKKHPNALIAEVEWKVRTHDNVRIQEMYIVGLINLKGVQTKTPRQYNVHSKPERQKYALELYRLSKSMK